MRELNPQEIEAVGGAGFLANAGQSIGQTLGGLVDSIFNVKSRFKTGFGQLGSSVGYLFEFNFTEATKAFSQGLATILQVQPIKPTK